MKHNEWWMGRTGENDVDVPIACRTCGMDDYDELYMVPVDESGTFTIWGYYCGEHVDVIQLVGEGSESFTILYECDRDLLVRVRRQRRWWEFWKPKHKITVFETTEESDEASTKVRESEG